MRSVQTTEEEEIIIGELIKKMAAVLNSRRRLVRVRGVKESSDLQAIALGAMFYKLREIQDPAKWDRINEEAQRIAALIGQPRR